MCGPLNPARGAQADEVFTSGTAVVVCSVGSITYKGQRRQYGEEGQPGAFEPTFCPLPLLIRSTHLALQCFRFPCNHRMCL